MENLYKENPPGFNAFKPLILVMQPVTFIFMIHLLIDTLYIYIYIIN